MWYTVRYPENVREVMLINEISILGRKRRKRTYAFKLADRQTDGVMYSSSTHISNG